MPPVPDKSLPAPLPGRPQSPVLCYVTDRNSLAPGDTSTQIPRLLEKIRAAIAAGIDWIQIREKDLLESELLTLTQPTVQAAHARGIRIIVNDRLEVAIAAKAAGVHLGRASRPVPEVVRWCREGNAPQGFLVGVSCHSLEEVREVEAAGASYVIFGPVFDTPSKRAFGEPAGVDQLATACAAVKIPVLAIGGVNAQNAPECLRAGAAGIAAIRMFQDARDAEELRNTVQSLRQT